MQVLALLLFKNSEIALWVLLEPIKIQFVSYCIDFVVLSSKYGEKENLFITISKYYSFLKTGGHIINQSEAFHNWLIP